MSPQQAIEYLTKITANISGTRQDHINIQQALQSLANLIKPVDKPKTKDVK